MLFSLRLLTLFLVLGICQRSPADYPIFKNIDGEWTISLGRILAQIRKQVDNPSDIMIYG